LIIVIYRLISAISVSKIRAARTTENMSSTTQHELNNCMNIAEVSAMQTDESTNTLNHSVLLAFKIQRIQATVKKFCLNKCLVGQYNTLVFQKSE
jgi:hypothetical protein